MINCACTHTHTHTHTHRLTTGGDAKKGSGPRSLPSLIIFMEQVCCVWKWTMIPSFSYYIHGTSVYVFVCVCACVLVCRMPLRLIPTNPSLIYYTILSSPILSYPILSYHTLQFVIESPLVTQNLLEHSLPYTLLRTFNNVLYGGGGGGGGKGKGKPNSARG